MNNLKRNKRWLYFCKRKPVNGRMIFEKPVKMKLNYQPIESTKTQGRLLKTGLDYVSTLIVYTNPHYGKEIHNGDRCYVFVKPPKTYDKTCTSADYYVNGEPKIYQNEYTFHLTRMVGDDYE